MLKPIPEWLKNFQRIGDIISRRPRNVNVFERGNCTSQKVKVNKHTHLNSPLLQRT